MANSNYTLLLQAQINAASIQEQLTAMAGKYTLAINAAVSSVQQAATTAVSGSGAGGVGGTSPISVTAAENVEKFKNALKTMHPVATTTNNVINQMVKANDAQVSGFGEVTKRAIGLSNNLEKFTDVTRRADVATKSWIGDLQNAFEKIALWAVATGIVYGSLKALKEGVEYIKDLNKEMTNIQIVTGFADSQIKNLTFSYNRLAGQLGATTLEVSRASLEFFRQGKTVEETAILTTQSIMMSKLANLDAAQSTEYLTSIINGFKLSIEEVPDILSKLISLDNAYATSTGEIALAMQRSSNSAQQAGISLEKLAAFITIISSTTRKSADSIGESMKTIFSRLETVKLGAMFEDDATTINDVEKALSLVNIRLRDTQDSFRPMGDVFDEIASKWSTMTQLEQSAVATTIAGKNKCRNIQRCMGTLYYY